VDGAFRENTRNAIHLVALFCFLSRREIRRESAKIQIKIISIQNPDQLMASP